MHSAGEPISIKRMPLLDAGRSEETAARASLRDAERPLPHARRHEHGAANAGGAGARAQGTLAARLLLGRGEGDAARERALIRALRYMIERLAA